ncbi:MAG: hypothetical protein RJR35_08025 [Thermoanaerobacterales bacterium]|nr:hypothetical protein [Thermoanaerobacterales bacterium]
MKVDALDEDVHAVGMAMVLLQQHAVESIRRVNEVQLDSSKKTAIFYERG